MGFEFEQVRQAFTAETEEDLAIVERSLLHLEKTPEDGESVATVFRKFHTLKGNAAALGLSGLAGFAHRVEDLLDGLRAGRVPVTGHLITYLLQVVDFVRSTLPDAAAGRDGLPPSAEPLLQQIEGGRFHAEPGAAEGEQAGPSADPAATTLRIDVGRLDHLLSVTSEIAIARGRLELLVNREGSPELAAAYHALDRLLAGLHHSISKVRMVPIAPLLHRHERVIRDLALVHRKEAELVVSDAGVEVDNSVVERLGAPLMHMVRNAVHHGLEAPEERARLGKPTCGRIELRARQEASDIVIEVADDGSGLDRRAIREKALSLGLVSDAECVSDVETDRLVFNPGLSTARRVSGTSGRGVGLDVVQRHVETLGGSVDVATRPGDGTTFTIRMPLTLAIIEGLCACVGTETFVIPMAGVVRCLDLAAPRGSDPGEGVLNLRGQAVPFARLRAVFAIDAPLPTREVAVVIERGSDVIALAVDQLAGRSQVVMKLPGRFFRGLPAISGLSILGDGQVAPILNVSGLLHEHLRRRGSAAADAGSGGAHA